MINFDKKSPLYSIPDSCFLKIFLFLLVRHKRSSSIRKSNNGSSYVSLFSERSAYLHDFSSSFIIGKALSFSSFLPPIPGACYLSLRLTDICCCSLYGSEHYLLLQVCYIALLIVVSFCYRPQVEERGSYRIHVLPGGNRGCNGEVILSINETLIVGLYYMIFTHCCLVETIWIVCLISQS